MQGATAALGHPPLIELSSWSPPATQKSNGHVKSGGTIAPLTPGGDRYADFAAWWVASLAQYAAGGVVPDYVSIQNEPDYPNTGWQTCIFDPTENATNAGYDKALDAVARAIAASGQSPAPKLLGPETAGFGKLVDYVSALETGPGIGEIEGIAHHMYNGASGSTPRGFFTPMSSVATMGAQAGKPLFMTEYGPNAPDMFNTAWLVNTAVTVEGVSAYLFWPLTWVPPAAGAVPTALITTEGGPPTNWKTPNGYTINDLYYGIRHFSKWIEPGWQRVEASSTAPVIALSAFISPDGQQVTVVLLNTDVTDHSVTLDPGAFAFTTSAIYRTSGTDERTAPIGALAGAIALPAHSIATVTLGP